MELDRACLPVAFPNMLRLTGMRLLWYSVNGIVTCDARCCPYGRRLAPSSWERLLSLPDERKGAVLMVTYSDLIQIGILIVGIIGLVLQAIKKK